MKINAKSHWTQQQIEEFLVNAGYPVRLSFNNGTGHPMICSLWYLWLDGALWLASHADSYLIGKLGEDPRVSFEVSTNDYPYKGVRGKATAELIKNEAEPILKSLIDKYLGDTNHGLAQWLLSRVADEYAIRITPGTINSWDFSGRMSK